MEIRKPTTIKGVARKARVSPSTVSHVLNNTRYVSEELKIRVLRAVEELNYRPNAMARGLRLQSSGILGLVVPDNSNPFFAEVAMGVEECGFKHGYSLILCNSRGDLARELTYMGVLNSLQVDGLILISATVSSDHINEMVKQGVVIVVVDRKMTDVKAQTILSDHFSGACQAIDHLIKLGHAQIGCISGPSQLSPSQDRLRGYETVIKSNGLTVLPELIYEGDFQIESGRNGAEYLMSLPEPPTAIFASNDLMAIGVLQTLREMGIQVPEEVSVVGFDDIFLASLVVPSLTTVKQPTYELGKTAVEHLVACIEGADHPEHPEIRMPTRLVVRKSSGPVKHQ